MANTAARIRVKLLLSNAFADDVESVFAEIEVDGEPYIIAMDVAEYDGSWFILGPNIMLDAEYNSGISKK